MAQKMRDKFLKEQLSYHKEQGDEFSQKKVEGVIKREANERKYIVDSNVQLNCRDHRLCHDIHQKMVKKTPLLLMAEKT